MRSETTMQMVERHVREGEAHIVRQKEIIMDLEQGGCPTLTAKDLLRVLEFALESHRSHLEVLLREQP